MPSRDLDGGVGTAMKAGCMAVTPCSCILCPMLGISVLGFCQARRESETSISDGLSETPCRETMGMKTPLCQEAGMCIAFLHKKKLCLVFMEIVDTYRCLRQWDTFRTRFFKFLGWLIYFETDWDSMSKERGKQSEKSKQAPHGQRTAWWGCNSWNPEIMTWAETKS